MRKKVVKNKSLHGRSHGTFVRCSTNQTAAGTNVKSIM